MGLQRHSSTGQVLDIARLLAESYVSLDRNRKDKTMKRIRNNDLTHYFFRDHSELPESYLKHCREFFESLGIKTKANELQAEKLQAASRKRQAAAETSCKKKFV